MLAGSKQGIAPVIGISLAIETAVVHPLWNIPMDSNAVVWDYPDTVVLIWACLFEPASTLKCSQQVTQAELCFQHQETFLQQLSILFPLLEYNKRNLFCPKLSSPGVNYFPSPHINAMFSKAVILLCSGLEEHLLQREAEESRHDTCDRWANLGRLSVVYVYWQNTKNEGKWHLNGLTAS